MHKTISTAESGRCRSAAIRAALLALFWLGAGLEQACVAAAPLNDNCAGAFVIPGAGPFPYSAPVTNITSATTSAAEMALTNILSNVSQTNSGPSGAQPYVSRGVWYVFTPSQSGPYTISSCSTATTVGDTVIGVFTSIAGCEGPFAFVDADDDACGQGVTLASVSTHLLADTTYYIVVWKYNLMAPAAGNGMVELSIAREVVAPNDTCESALPVFLNIPVSGSTVGAANDYQLGNEACFTGIGQAASGVPGRDVVYSFTAPETGSYSIKAFRSTAYDLVIYVGGYTLPGVGPQTVNTCLAAANRNPASSAEDIPCLPLTNGQLVYIYIDDDDANAGSSFNLEVTRCVWEAEPNNSPATASPLTCGMSGSVNPIRDEDYFILGNFPAGWRAFVMVDGEAANLTDFQLRVVTTNLMIEFDDDDNDLTFGRSSPNIAGTILPGGPAFAQVTYNGLASAEPYRIYGVVQPPMNEAAIEVEPNDLIALADNDEVSYYAGELAGPAPSIDVDVFSITASDGDVFFISLDEDPLRNNTPVNAQLELLDDHGNVILTANDNNSISSANSPATNFFAVSPRSPAEALAYRSPGEGVYYVRVSVSPTATGSTAAGDYLLSISRNCGKGSLGSPHPPELTNIDVPSQIPEGGTVTLSGTLSDFDTGESLRLVVDWGDGTSNVLPYPGGRSQFSMAHDYPDDAPAGTAADAYLVQVSATDNLGHSASQSLPVMVTNVAPQAALSLNDYSVEEGTIVLLDGSFYDPGLRDVHQIRIDWGDGSPFDFAVPEELEGLFTAQHLYLDDKPGAPGMDAVIITVTINDQDLGTNTAGIGLNVANLPPGLSNVALSGSPASGDSVTLTGAMVDPGILDALTLTINWGDGTAPIFSPYPAGSTSFSQSHVYNTGETNLVINVELADDDGGTDSVSLPVHVSAGLQRPVISAFYYYARVPNPEVLIEFSGMPLTTYRVEKTMDFQTWTTVGQAISDESGYFEISDSMGNPGRQLYRAVSVP